MLWSFGPSRNKLIFFSPGPETKAPETQSSRGTHRLNSPPLSAAHNNHMPQALRWEWLRWATVENTRRSEARAKEALYGLLDGGLVLPPHARLSIDCPATQPERALRRRCTTEKSSGCVEIVHVLPKWIENAPFA